MQKDKIKLLLLEITALLSQDSTEAEVKIKDGVMSCPFCGGEPEVKNFNSMSGSQWMVRCQCGGHRGTSQTRGAAIDKWNLRG
tara:strand:- start:5126 stop:5374 length:249 start_codon:yes stop_codon:yes gene_type:complete